MKAKTETPRPTRGVSGHREASDDQGHSSTKDQEVYCPLCGQRHDEILTLLAQEPLRRIASADLVDELEYVEREIVQSKMDQDYGSGLAALHRHRRAVIKGELDRRRRLERFGGPKVLGGGRIDPAIIAEIKERIDLVNLVGEDLEMASYRPGRGYFHCRLHGDGVDGTASLIVYEDDNRFWCFGCDDGGDCFDWLIKARNFEWIDAVCYLAARCRIELRRREPKPGLVGAAL